MMLTSPEHIERYGILVLKKRLEMEIKFPEWASSPAGRITMRSVKSLGFPGRTRKQALDFVTCLLEVA